MRTPNGRFNIGEEYTFIKGEPFIKEDGSPVALSDMVMKIFSTATPAAVFKVEMIHAKGGQFSYTTRFVGYHIIRKTDEGLIGNIEPTIPKE